jgi:general secretion pathway protein K
MKYPQNPLKNERGVALLIAMFAMMLLTFIAIEVSYDTTVDYVVAAQQVNRIKAHYAAKAGVDISLLRIMLYKQVMSQFGDQLESAGTGKQQLDIIWSFPFMWPPTGLYDNAKGSTSVEKNMVKQVVKDSMMTSSYSATISPEGGRLDINDLGSPVESLKKAMMQQVVKIFLSEVEHNEKFADKYRGYRFEELVNNIADYIDEDMVGSGGGDEKTPYRDWDDKDYEMPPNRPLRTVDELHMVAGMNEDFYNVLAPRITVFGTKGVNVNYADKDTLMALDPSMSEEAVSKILERRNDPKLGGPFQDQKDFFGFIQGYGVNAKAIEQSGLPLLFGMEFNFRIVSTGLAANVKREITAVTYDYANLTGTFADMLDKQDQDKGLTPEQQQQQQQQQKQQQQQTNQQNQQQQPAKQKTKIQASKGRPSIVYWEEN